VLDEQGVPILDENGDPLMQTVVVEGSLTDSLMVGGGIALAGAMLIGAWILTRR
jgi:hypothetical protein